MSESYQRFFQKIHNDAHDMQLLATVGLQGVSTDAKRVAVKAIAELEELNHKSTVNAKKGGLY